MSQNPVSVNEKALSINRSQAHYGTFAEIGAGQEIARWFFKVGGASGTIAKAISAYDMTFSDAIYGPEPSGRYVVEDRVKRMLDYEYDLLADRLTGPEHDGRCLFALANTVAAKSPRYTGDCHGWMGIKFQHAHGAEPSEIILHMRLLDTSNRQQQIGLGILGVNLLYAGLNHYDNIENLIQSLTDGELEDRFQINTLRLSGPAFEDVDVYWANLQLLKKGLTPALLVCANGTVSHLDEELYKKEVLIHRAAFNPITCSDMDMLKSARDHFCGSKTEGECAPFLLSEIYAPDLDKTENETDILHRLKMLLLSQQNTLITNIQRTHALHTYLELFSKEHINYVYPAKKLLYFFERNELSSLESLTQTFRSKTHMYLYPTPIQQMDPKYLKDGSQDYFTLENYQPSDLNIHLFHHLKEKGYLEDIKGHHCDPSLLISDADLQKQVESKNSHWKRYVPEDIGKYIESNKLYAC